MEDRVADLRSRWTPGATAAAVAKLTLDAAVLARFPEGYRHLAYLQTKIGITIKLDLPQLKGPVVEALYILGQAWLDGRPFGLPVLISCARVSAL